ncbi:Protein of unknown function [Ferrimonas sediminum]|uniref:DUF3570 domain-containing protein n=1 Tax=Ferrimonas sediminum TaxID=718193 RepID=A0A1G8N6T8_9GAMM|nr:DUF3570 domain-containing protein [Ferrimonas sediminum]SDI75912.1 Protein of unknown function [Ferrimonas sediminum]
MQLTPFSNITAALAVATVPLVQAGGDVAGLEPEWNIDAAFLYYSEGDNRVDAYEGVLKATRSNADDQILGVTGTLDVLTGASPNGAVPQNQLQTFTRPSGKGEYQIQPGVLPLDDSFKDTRAQLNLQWTSPLNRAMGYTSGLHISKEYDYLSLGLNGGLSRDFNQKNTTLALSGAIFFDTIEPEGGTPVGLSTMAIRDDFPSEEAFQQAFNATRSGSDDTKTTWDLRLGVTQVLTRRWIMQTNISYARVDGYQNDFLKLLSVVDATGTAVQYRYEQRPDSRNKMAFFWQSKYHFGPIADISYRYMSDDWEIDSHTLDGRLRFEFGRHSLEPHLRYYTQSAAEFYQPFLITGTALPHYASADYRIGELDTYTVGIKYDYRLNDNQRMAVRLSWYHQAPVDDDAPKPGQLQQQELYPTLDTLMLQTSYHF